MLLFRLMDTGATKEAQPVIARFRRIKVFIRRLITVMKSKAVNQIKTGRHRIETIKMGNIAHWYLDHLYSSITSALPSRRG